MIGWSESLHKLYYDAKSVHVKDESQRQEVGRQAL
jgi:hypothetical protein